MYWTYKINKWFYPEEKCEYTGPSLKNKLISRFKKVLKYGNMKTAKTKLTEETLEKSLKVLTDVTKSWQDVIDRYFNPDIEMDKVAFEESMRWVYKDLLELDYKFKIVYLPDGESLMKIIRDRSNQDGSQLNNTAHKNSQMCTEFSIKVINKLYSEMLHAPMELQLLIYASIKHWESKGLNEPPPYKIRSFATGPLKSRYLKSVGVASHLFSIPHIMSVDCIADFCHYEQILTLHGEEDPLFERFENVKKLLASKFFASYFHLDTLYVIEPPKMCAEEVINKTYNQINSIKAPTLEFPSGQKFYLSNNVIIPQYLGDKIFDDTITFEDILQIGDEEVKAAVLNLITLKYGTSKIIDLLGSNMVEVDTYTDIKDENYLEGTTKGMNIGVYTLFKGTIVASDPEQDDFTVAFVRCYCPSTDRMFFLTVEHWHTNAKDAIASLYRIPIELIPHIERISRQGERFATVLTEEGKAWLKQQREAGNIGEIFHESQMETISGDDYFRLLTYEY